MELISQTKEIYGRLEDGLSRKIFENRLLFSLTGDKKFIDDIVSLSFPINECKVNLNSFFEKYDNNIIVYGAGFLAWNFMILCDKARIVAFCDSDKEKQGIEFMGYKVISPEELKKNYNDSYVVITTLMDKDNSDILNNLLNMGFRKDRIMIFKEFLKSINMDKLYSQYFDADIINPVEQSGVFVDAGCYNGNDTSRFMEWCNNNYKKIIAFEPNPVQYSLCIEKLKSINNISVYPYGLWNENTELTFSESGSSSCIAEDLKENIIKIKTVKLDDILNGEEATFIKMDVEGSELNALRGSEQTILKYRPKFAICVYHKPEDIWELPAYLLSLHSDYKFYLRHYSLDHIETVLYAV